MVPRFARQLESWSEGRASCDVQLNNDVPTGDVSDQLADIEVSLAHVSGCVRGVQVKL